ncbi:MAG: winged helix DNA-binding domain-containing protein [bacterium]|nr:winged helix DNA-binding domain-containing protein [bacterium]
MKTTITKAQARRFLLTKQLLNPPKTLSGAGAIEKVFNTLRLIQYDPLNPCGRNTDLVLQSRIRDYHPDGFYRWLYTEKKGIECYDKELCIIPIEDFPLITHRQTRTQDHPYWSPFIKKYQKEIEELLKLLEKNGPLTAKDIGNKTRIEGNWTENATFGRVALDTLWRIGRVAIVKREKGRKYYDLATNIYGSELLTGKTELAEEHILRRINSVGMLQKSGTEEGWQGLKPGRAKTALVQKLINEEKLLEVSVEGSNKSYAALRKDELLLNKTAQMNKKGITKMIFLAPLDNLIWDRAMTEDLFSFFYRWEVYTPLAKRKFGYYALPILFGDRIIGQIEPILNKDKNLEIKGFWRQPNEEWTEAENQALNTALEEFRKYLRAKEIIRPSVKASGW